ncbi:MAG TPA: hypothetical protein VIL20_08830 [Sandaracinaceae bacterium]
MARTKKTTKKPPSRDEGVRIPERPDDMPGGPHGGRPVTPRPKKKKAGTRAKRAG